MSKKKLTEADKEAYVEDPWGCPYCESANIKKIAPGFTFEVCSFDVECFDCGKTWTDIYRLVKIEEDESTR